MFCQFTKWFGYLEQLMVSALVINVEDVIKRSAFFASVSVLLYSSAACALVHEVLMVLYLLSKFNSVCLKGLRLPFHNSYFSASCLSHSWRLFSW